MQIKLTYKSYSGNGLDIKQGDVCTVGEEMGRKLIETYPKWFVVVDGAKPEAAKPAGEPEAEPKGNEDGGGGPNKETKPGKATVKK